MRVSLLYKLSVVLTVVALACASVWADTWSWAGKSGDVTIPAGTEATVADGDIATVEALTGIAVEAGASLTFANTQPIVINANLSGAGAISGNATCTDPRVPAANRLACIVGEGVIRAGKFGLAVIVR